MNRRHFLNTTKGTLLSATALGLTRRSWAAPDEIKSTNDKIIVPVKHKPADAQWQGYEARTPAQLAGFEVGVNSVCVAVERKFDRPQKWAKTAMKRRAGRTGALGLLTLGLLALGLPVAAQQAPAEPREGVWLRNGVAEAFVSARPYPRVTTFRCSGAASPLLDASHPWSGVRTWFMEPHQVAHSQRPSNRPARIAHSEPLRVVVESEVDEQSRLSVQMEVRLDATKPVLHVRHMLQNHAAHERTLAAWGIVSFPVKGRFVLPFGEAYGASTVRTLAFFNGTSPAAPALAYGNDALTIHLEQPVSPALKVGVRFPPGWAAWNDGETALRVASPAPAGALYPEGGANVTAFLKHGETGINWAELENVGPLSRVKPGETLALEQTLTLLPALTPDATPDEWRRLLAPATNQD